MGVGYTGSMSKVDEIKEELGWLKVAFGVLIVTIVSVLGWLVQNLRVAERVTLIGAIIVLAILISITTWLNKFAYRKIRSLKDL